MDTDLEQAGAFVSAGLAASELDRNSLAVDSTPGSPRDCLNCGGTVAGRYCQMCGQATHLHRSLLHLLEELLHSVLHFDAKGWRTLPLLLARPGVLTRRYIDGQRMRYVSPLALFLFSSFLMFFILTLVFDHAPSVPVNAADRKAAHTELAAGVAEAQQQVARARAALERAQQSGHDPQDVQEELSSALTDQRVAEAALKLADAAITRTEAAPTAEATVASQAANAAPVKRGLEQLSDLKIDTGVPLIDEVVHRALHNPELFFYRLENTAYKFLFMLIPISLPFLWLLFIGRRGITVYDHAVFSLYSLSFMSFLIVAFALLVRTGFARVAALSLILLPPVHMFLQLRGTYGLGVFAALWRTCALLAVAGTAFVLFVLFVILVSLR